MSTTARHAPATAALLHRYAADLGIPMALQSATMQMRVDDIYTLQLKALPGEGIMLSAYLKPLPPAGLARDELLRAFARLACGTMKEQATTCSIDARERAIWLQLPAPAHSLQDIDDAVGVFVNSLSFWSKASSSL